MALSFANAMLQLTNSLIVGASMEEKIITAFKAGQATHTTGADGERFVSASTVIQTIRNGLNSVFEQGQFQSLLRPALLEVGEAINAPSAITNDQLFDFIFDFMVTNAQSVEARDITFGSVAAGGGNVGDGTIHRLTVDKNNQNIEAMRGVELKQALIVEDQSSLGQSGRHKEVIRFTGVADTIDNFDRISGTVGGVFAIDQFPVQDEVSRVLRNSSFTTNNSSGTVTTMFPGWTLSSLTGVLPDTTTFFRNNFGVTGASMKVSSTGAGLTFSQKFRGLNLARPYLPILRFNPTVGSAPAGTQITIKLGSQPVQTLTTVAETGWNTMVMDLDSDLWVPNFTEDEVELVIGVPTLASGDLYLDEILTEPMNKIDGTWWLPIGGATPFQLDDIFTMTDSFTSSDAILQRFLAYAFSRHLPHSGTPTIADPTLPA